MHPQSTITKHSFVSYSFGFEIRLFVNKILVAETDVTPLNSWLSGGMSYYIKEGTNLIEIDFRPSPSWEIKKAHEGEFKNIPQHAHILIEEFENGNIYKLLANYRFYLDANSRPHVAIFDPDDENHSMTNEEIMRKYDYLSKRTKITIEKNGYTRVTIPVIAKSVMPLTWMSATPYQASSHRKILENAYHEYWQVLNQSIQSDDWAGLFNFCQVYFKDMAKFESNEKSIFELASPKKMIQEGRLMLRKFPLLGEFDVEQNEDGRLVRLRKSMNIDGIKGMYGSPIIYLENDQPSVSVDSYFSILNDKAVLSIF